MNRDSPLRAPFVGPEPFGVNDHRNFFGRNREMRDLGAMVISQALVTVFGASGTGKSSLLTAGIGPALWSEFGTSMIDGGRLRTFGDDRLADQAAAEDNYFSVNLLRTLFRARDRSAETLDSDWYDCMKELRASVGPKMTLLEGFRELRYQIDRLPVRQPDRDNYRQLIVVIDQAEELFTDRPDLWAQRQPFLKQLHQALDPANYDGPDRESGPPHVVMAIREDFVGQLLSEGNFQRLPELRRHTFRLEGLLQDPALDAIRRPLEPTGVRFATGVAEEVLMRLRTAWNPERDDATFLTETVEPVHLQVTCLKLWNLVVSRGGNEISFDDLKRLGSIEKALGEYYDEEVRAAMGLPGASAFGERKLRLWLSKKLTTKNNYRVQAFVDEELPRTGLRRLTDRLPFVSGTAAPPAAVLARLDQRHVLRRMPRGRGFLYEIAHDQLVKPIRESNDAFLQAAGARRRTRRTRIGVAAVFLIGTIIGYGFLGAIVRTIWMRDLDGIHAAAGDPQLSAGLLAETLTAPPWWWKIHKWGGDRLLRGAEESFEPRSEVLTTLLETALLSPELEDVLVHDASLAAIHVGQTRILSVDETGLLLTSGKTDGVRSWSKNLDTPVMLDGWTTPTGAVAITEAADKAIVVAASEGNMVRLWRVRPGQARAAPELLTPSPHLIRALALAPDGATIAVAVEDGTHQWHVLHVDAVRNGKTGTIIAKGVEKIFALAFEQEMADPRKLLAIVGCAERGGDRDECLRSQVRFVVDGPTGWSPADVGLLQSVENIREFSGAEFLAKDSGLALRGRDTVVVAQLCGKRVSLPECPERRGETWFRRDWSGQALVIETATQPASVGRPARVRPAIASAAATGSVPAVPVAHETAERATFAAGAATIVAGRNGIASVYNLSRQFPGAEPVVEVARHRSPIERIFVDPRLKWIVGISARSNDKRRDLYLWRRRSDGWSKHAEPVPVSSSEGIWTAPVLAAAEEQDGRIIVAAERNLLQFPADGRAAKSVEGFDFLGQTAAAFGGGGGGGDPLFVYGTAGRQLFIYRLKGEMEPVFDSTLLNPASCANGEAAALSRGFGRYGIGSMVLEGSLLVALDRGTCLHVHDISRPKELTALDSRSLTIPIAEVVAASRHNAAVRLAAGTFQGSILLWQDVLSEPSDPKELRSPGDRSFITRIAFTDEPDWIKDYIFALDMAGRTTIWEARSGADARAPPVLPLHGVATQDIRIAYEGGDPILVSTGIDLRVNAAGRLEQVSTVRSLRLDFLNLPDSGAALTPYLCRLAGQRGAASGGCNNAP
ncbi:WD40 repeat domain-containing protein [Ensifer adhaerens]|uniref:Novel STAND NTPase 1 domain-containing protein n=1 Tax=Ensifer adhaerens TaxID=106592 RepID=A0A9Q8YG76_ENSAD|nr:hypothetical protein [Ensifer adhaerens]USJ27560.1 hypothetical protein NE863_34625 [Ensifer adhaerens]